MEVAIADRFFVALESAKIDNYEVITDTAYTHYYNNEDSILKYKDGIILGIKKQPQSGTMAYGDSQVAIYTSDAAHICEARLGGTIDQIKKFISVYGFNLTDDEMKILIKLYYSNTKIIPPTGDYYKFDKLPEEEYNKLTPEEKEKYDKALAEYETNYKKNHIKNPGFVGQIN